MSTTAPEVHWTTLELPTFPYQPLHLAATKHGLCRITLPNESFLTLKAWTDKKIPCAILVQDDDRLSAYVRQLQEYFAGTRTTFTLPLDLRGTSFQTAVWQALNEIPFGQTRRYSDIAEAVGRPAAVRAVGTANGANPIPIVVPCHRVIGKNDALTGFRGGLKMKAELLQLEGFAAYSNKGHARYQF